MTKNDTITPKTRVPLYVVGSAIGLAILMTAEWESTKAEIQSIGRDAMTERQAQYWIDDFRDQNPTLRVPRLPQKSAGKSMPSNPTPMAENGD